MRRAVSVGRLDVTKHRDRFMRNSIIKTAIAAAAIAALPGAAQAGTATDTKSASFTVASQCSVTGATVNLGSYTSNTTWAQVGASLGLRSTGFTAGSKGFEYLDYGSVTCDSGTPYTLTIKGTNATGNAGTAKMTLNGKTIRLEMGIKKLDGVTLPDSSAAWPGTGRQVWSSPVSGTGTGNPQVLLGNMTVYALAATDPTFAAVTDTLGAVGQYSDTLTYTLTF